MIEKITPDHIVGLDGLPTTIMPDSAKLMRKINELVDAVNTIQKEREAERFEIQEWIGILEAVRKSVNIHEKQIDKLQMKAEPEKVNMDIESPVVKMWKEKLDKIERENRAKIDRQIVETLIRPSENMQDKFAEQRKWIGKLCWFSQLYGCHQHIAILKRISESGLYVTDDGELHYAYCEPVKPDEDIIYKGCDNVSE